MIFHVVRVTEDKEGVFIVGDIYLAQITELDFIYEKKDSMEIHLKNERVDLEGLWATSDFEREFNILNNQTNKE